MEINAQFTRGKENLVPIGYESDRTSQLLAILWRRENLSGLEPRISIPSPVTMSSKLPSLLGTYCKGKMHWISVKRKDTCRPDNCIYCSTCGPHGNAECWHWHWGQDGLCSPPCPTSFLVVRTTLSYLLFSFFFQTFLFIIFSFAKVPV